MEDLNQSYGYILYRTHITGPIKGTLSFDALHQYADIYIDGKLAGSLDRRLNQKSLDINVTSPDAQLDVLVENTGRINFGPRINGERIGIIGDAHLNEKTLTGWDIYSLPMEAPQKLAFTNTPCEGACFYRTTLNITKPVDTYLDTRQLGKGMVWINGKPLGRFWHIGPQGSLYLPASWLHSGANNIVIFDLYAKPNRSTQGLPNLITDLSASTLQPE